MYTHMSSIIPAEINMDNYQGIDAFNLHSRIPHNNQFSASNSTMRGRGKYLLGFYPIKLKGWHNMQSVNPVTYIGQGQLNYLYTYEYLD